MYYVELASVFFEAISGIINNDLPEIKTWLELSGNDLSTWETETLMLMIREYTIYIPQAKNPDELSPLMTEEEKIAQNTIAMQEHIKNLSKRKR